MLQNPPPVLGFNNNVRHRGRVFHIQTEDSGVKSPRIVTHLFADGGRIIKTTRTAYAEHLERSDLAQHVRQMMKEQHKAMFAALRAGDLDELLEASCGPLPLPPAAPRTASAAELMASSDSSAIIPAVQISVAEPAAVAEPAPVSSASPSLSARPTRPLSNPNIFKIPPSVPPPSREAIDLAVGGLESEKSAPAAARKARSLPTQATASSARPASRYGTAPSASSIFGDGVISEKSLDEVILSYLAEDLDGPSE